MLIFVYMCNCTCTTWLKIDCCSSQNKRGGKVKLQSIVMPLTEFDHPEKGDALYGKSHLQILFSWKIVMLSWCIPGGNVNWSPILQ